MDRVARALVVAHPDDETLWAGGLLLRNPGDWTVIACSRPASDPVRAEKFATACRRLGATASIVLPQVESYGASLTFDGLDLGRFGLVVTHGREGEYGHPHHIQTHYAVRERARCPTWFIGGETAIELTPAERAAKLHALKAYDHILPYEGVPRTKWEALLMRYGAQWLERESYETT